MNKFMRDMVGPNIRFFADDGDADVGSGPSIDTSSQSQADIDTGAVSKPWTDGAAYSSWDDDTKTSMAKFKSEADAVKAYPELNKKIGSMIAPPDGDTTKQRDILAKLGMPDKPEGYKFTYPDGFPEERQMDDREKGEFLAFAHQAGLLPAQLQESINYMAGKALSADRMAIPNAIKSATAHIHTNCPDDGQQVAQFARQLVEEHGGEGALDMVFAKNGQPINGPLCVMLGRIGEQAYGTVGFHQGTQQQQIEMRQNSLKLKTQYPNTPDD